MRRVEKAELGCVGDGVRYDGGNSLSMAPYTRRVLYASQPAGQQGIVPGEGICPKGTVVSARRATWETVPAIAERVVWCRGSGVSCAVVGRLVLREWRAPRRYQ